MLARIAIAFVQVARPVLNCVVVQSANGAELMDKAAQALVGELD